MLPLRLITDAPNGYDLKVLILPETVAQPVDVHVHRAGVRVGVDAPDVVHELLPREDMPRRGDELV